MNKKISREVLAKRWNCHPTAIDYRVRIGDLKCYKLNGKKAYLISQIEKVEKENPLKSKGRYAKPKVVLIFKNTDSVVTKVLKYLKLI